LIWVTATSAADRAEIVDIKIAQEEPSLRVSFSVENCFTPEMEEAIWSGVDATFRFLAMLQKPYLPLIPETITDVAFEHTIRYDRLRNEFTVHLEEHVQRVRTTNDFNEAKMWMSQVQDLSLIPLWRLQRGDTYYLSLKAELSKVRLPPFFRYIFFFVSLWDFETDWQTTTFTF
jgi:hypothetical protein